MPPNEMRALFFDFGFTLFYFKEPSVERYLPCFKKGLSKVVDLLREEEVLEEEPNIARFTKKFNRVRSKSWKESLKSRREYPTKDIFKRVLAITIEEGKIKSLEKKTPNFYGTLATLFHSEEEKEWKPFKQTKTTLKRLSRKGLTLAVISNHPHHSTIERILRREDLLPYFELIMTSAKHGTRKPNPEIFYHCLRKMGLSDKGEEEIWMIGDEYADIKGAREAGLTPILCEREYKFPFEKEINLSNLRIIKNISEIIDLISP